MLFSHPFLRVPPWAVVWRVHTDIAADLAGLPRLEGAERPQDAFRGPDRYLAPCCGREAEIGVLQSGFPLVEPCR